MRPSASATWRKGRPSLSTTTLGIIVPKPRVPDRMTRTTPAGGHERRHPPGELGDVVAALALTEDLGQLRRPDPQGDAEQHADDQRREEGDVDGLADVADPVERPQPGDRPDDAGVGAELGGVGQDREQTHGRDERAVAGRRRGPG